MLGHGLDQQDGRVPSIVNEKQLRSAFSIFFIGNTTRMQVGQ
jgi:hypothetical protein